MEAAASVFPAWKGASGTTPLHLLFFFLFGYHLICRPNALTSVENVF